MKKELILLITILLFTACKQDPKVELKELVAYWQDREIVFPEAMQFARYAEEVVKLNPLPDNSSFHTFLLDKNSKVLVIGSPVLNPTVKDLYVKEISRMPTEDKLAETQLSFEMVEYDPGTIQLRDTIERQIKLKNSGSSVFRLKDIISSCDCTKVLRSGLC